MKKEHPFSWWRIAGFGWLTLNKGISGGGYGPVVTVGQVLSGVRGRNAVGITSLAEGITSIVGVGIYYLSGASISWHLATPLILGAVISVPLSAYIVSRLPSGKLTTIIGGISTALGGYTLRKVTDLEYPTFTFIHQSVAKVLDSTVSVFVSLRSSCWITPHLGFIADSDEVWDR